MNQILVTERLYVTPELRRKKKLYKINFLISIFLVCILISLYIYAEYDRNKSEEVSQEILEEIQIPENTSDTTDTTVAKNNVLVVILNEEEPDNSSQESVEQPTVPVATARKVQTTKGGYKYTSIATINIPKIGIKYAILDGETGSAAETEALLKMSPTKFWGPEPNEEGNFCIVGHNYRNSKFFSKVPTLTTGDIIEIIDLSGRKINYRVYNKYEVVPTDVSCTTQRTNGNKEITVITCTDDSKLRVVVKAREVK